MRYKLLLLFMLLAISCQKPTINEVLVKTDFAFFENGSMVKSLGDKEDILDAIYACNPDSLPVVATKLSDKSYFEFKAGETVRFKFTNYQFATSFVPSGYSWISDICKVATRPFIYVNTTHEFVATDTQFTIPATYSCIALVVPKDECSGFRLYINSTWTDLPSVESGNYRLIFMDANLEFANTIMALPSSSDYLQKTFNAPKSQTNNGKYFFFRMPTTTTEAETSISYADWESGGW